MRFPQLLTLPPTWIATAALALVVGCGGGDEVITPVDTGEEVDPDWCEEDTDCGFDEICNENACVPGDRDNSFEDATALLWSDEVLGVLNPDGDVDYYRIEADGGEWIKITTRAGNTDEGEDASDEDMDTVVTIYETNGKVVAWEDDHAVGSVSTYDTVIYSYFAEAGEYIIAVEDASSYYGGDADGGDDFYYYLEVEEVSANTDETDSFEDPGATVDAYSSGYIWAVGALIGEEGDSDYVTMELPSADGTPILLRGSANEEGSDLNTTVRVWTTDQTLLLEQEDLGTENYAFYPSVGTDSVIVEITDANGGGGDNHWGYVYFTVYESPYSTTISNVDYEIVKETEPNDSIETSEYVAHHDFATDGGSDYTGAFVWGDLGTSVDEDWYSFSVADGSYLQAYMSASEWGSGADPVLEIYDAAGDLLDSFSDGSAGGTGPDFEDYGPLEGGLIYLRVIDEQKAPIGGEQDFYRLMVYFTSWEMNK